MALSGADLENGGGGIRAQTQPSLSSRQDIINPIPSLSQPLEMSDLSIVRQSDGVALHTEAVDAKERLEEDHHSNAVEKHDLAKAPESLSPTPNILLSGPQGESAIGPATDKPTIIHSSPSTGLQVIITLLLHATDTRHPYIINEKYLSRRNVSVTNKDPVNMTVYTLKELIWRDWRDEWEARPASPTSIRLIHMGRMLDDKAHLKECRFSSGNSPHVVHMTIKPQEVIDDEDARIAKGSPRDRSGNERTHGCRCIIM